MSTRRPKLTPKQRLLLMRLSVGRSVVDDDYLSHVTVGRPSRTEKTLHILAEKGLIDWSEGVSDISITQAGRAALKSGAFRHGVREFRRADGTFAPLSCNAKELFEDRDRRGLTSYSFPMLLPSEAQKKFDAAKKALQEYLSVKHDVTRDVLEGVLDQIDEERNPCAYGACGCADAVKTLQTEAEGA